MNKHPDQSGTLEAALGYAGRGLPIFPVRGKVPAVRGWQQFVADEVKLRVFCGRGCGVALRTGESGYVVVDTDTDEAERWADANLPDTGMRALSGAGSRHRYFASPEGAEVRNRQGWNGIQGLDVRGQGGYIVLPPSLHPETGRPYLWLAGPLPPAELPRFSPEWVKERTRQEVVRSLAAHESPDFMTMRASRWLTRVAAESPAVSGEGGHNATYRVANKLVHYFRLDRDTAIRLMLTIYNPCCRPPWDEESIEHKVDSAIERGHAP